VRFRTEQPCDYASNHTEASGLPDGIGAEVLSSDALRRAVREATSASDREHVTTFIRALPGEFRVLMLPPPDPAWPFLKLDVDTADDLERMRSLAERLPRQNGPLWDVATLVSAV
jgi:spore coat polysaccharide biosynthesis protein SpsF